MRSIARKPGFVVLVAHVLVLVGGGARADGAAARPAFDVAVGAGLSMDAEARNPQTGDESPMPAYLVSLGVGAGGIGLTGRLVANAPSGNPSSPEVQRVGVDLQAVFRPFAWRPEPTATWGRRVLRSLSVGLGPVAEQVSLSTKETQLRFGAAVDVHVDVPFAGDADTGELRGRLGARRAFAKTRTFRTRSVADAEVDLYAALALVF